MNTNTKTSIRVAPWMQDTLRDGFTALAAGRLNEASACCKRLLGAKPDMVEAHFLVGLIAIELKQTWTAVNAFGSVTTLQEDHSAAWANMARLFVLAGQPARADAALEKAVLHNDGNPTVLDLIGTIHAQLGEQDEAALWFKKALQKQPKRVPFLVNLANNYIFRGKIAQAENVLHKTLDLQPGNPNAHWMIATIRKATNHEHVEELQKLAAEEHRQPRALAFLSYGLGKELEDLEEWDDAFDAFAAGAAARRKTISFDEQSEIEMYDAFCETFTSRWLDESDTSCDDAAPIFVIGQPRTGTTLVERIITSHSQVFSAGELRQFGHSVRRLAQYEETKRDSAKLPQKAVSIDGKKLGEAYIRTTRKVRGDLPRFVDKLPPNYMYLPLILKALPNARIIHLTRNPMDACFASFKQLFADAYPHSYDQAEMARHHARYYRMMETWRERFGDRFLDVAYEDTARDLEPNARAIIEFLQLPWEDACLNFHKQDAAVTTASAVQVREPAHTRSIGRWRRYEKQLSVMRETLEEQGIPLGQD